MDILIKTPQQRLDVYVWLFFDILNCENLRNAAYMCNRLQFELGVKMINLPELKAQKPKNSILAWDNRYSYNARYKWISNAIVLTEKKIKNKK